MNNINDIRPSTIYKLPLKRKVKMLNLKIDPETIAKTFSKYVKSIMQILLWTTIGAAALAVTYVALSGIWMAVEFALKELGV